MRSFEARPEGSWVVVLFAQSLDKNYSDIRLFPTMDLCMSVYAKSTRTKHVYASAGEMATRHTERFLWKYLDDVIEQYHNPEEHYKTSAAYQGASVELKIAENERDREIIAGELWRICQVIGDKIPHLSSEAADNDEDMFKVRIDRMSTEEGRAQWEKFPKQARQIVEALMKNAKSIVAEDELQKMMQTLVADRVMKTKQDPWRIFSYYAPMLGDHGLLYYPGKRHKVEDHEANL